MRIFINKHELSSVQLAHIGMILRKKRGFKTIFKASGDGTESFRHMRIYVYVSKL